MKEEGQVSPFRSQDPITGETGLELEAQVVWNRQTGSREKPTAPRFFARPSRISCPPCADGDQTAEGTSRSPSAPHPGPMRLSWEGYQLQAPNRVSPLTWRDVPSVLGDKQPSTGTLLLNRETEDK